MHEDYMKGKTGMTHGYIADNTKNGHKTVHTGAINVGSSHSGKASKMVGTGSKAKGKLKHFSKVAIGTAAKAGKIHGGVS